MEWTQSISSLSVSHLRAAMEDHEGVQLNLKSSPYVRNKQLNFIIREIIPACSFAITGDDWRLVQSIALIKKHRWVISLTGAKIEWGGATR